MNFCLSKFHWFKIKLHLPLETGSRENLYRQIKDKHSVIIWPAVHCFFEFAAAASIRWHAVPTRCPSNEPEPVLKDASHAQTSLDPKKSTQLLIYLSRDSLLSAILMNASCFWASQSGTSYLTRDQSDIKCFGGKSYVRWLISVWMFVTIDCKDGRCMTTSMDKTQVKISWKWL